MGAKPRTASGYTKSQVELVRATCLYVATKVGENLYNRGVLNSMIIAEAIRNLPFRFRVASLRPREQSLPFGDRHLVRIQRPTEASLSQLPRRFRINNHAVRTN